MKKITLIILALFVITTGALFAGNVQAIDNNAWLDHTAKMQVLRENILTLVSKELPTATDKAELDSLMQLFSAEKKQWTNYLEQVAKAPKVSDAAGNCGTEERYKRHGYRNYNCNSKLIGKCPRCDGSCKKAKECRTTRKYKRHGYRNYNCNSKLIGKCPRCDGSCTKAIARTNACKTASKKACKPRKHGYRNKKCNSKLIGNCPRCDGSCKKAKEKECITENKTACKTTYKKAYKTRKHGYRNKKCNSKLIGNCPRCDGSCKKAKEKECTTASKSPCKVKKHTYRSNCK